MTPMVRTPLHMKRHTLSRRSPRQPRFRKRKDEESESNLERKMLSALKYYVPELEVKQQHKFHDEVAWRFDFCYLEKQVAIEVQGFGVGHNSYSGMKGDYDKHNAALLLGWKVIYFMSIDLEDENLDVTISIIRGVLGLTNGTKTQRSRSTEIETLRRRLTQKPNF